MSLRHALLPLALVAASVSPMPACVALAAMASIPMAQAQTVPVLIAPSQPIVRSPADARAEAMRLSVALLPDVAFTSLVPPMFDAIMESREASDAFLRKTMDERPEIRAAIRKAAVPAIQAVLAEALPVWRAEMRDLLMTRLSADETRQLADFLNSPAGQKVYLGAMTYAATHPDQETVDGAMMRALMASLTPDDMAALDHFSTLPVSSKFDEITGAIKPMLARWSQDIMRDQGPRLARIMQDALAPYAPGAKRP